MNGIFLLRRTDKVGYDEFDSFVVIAPDEEFASRAHPESAWENQLILDRSEGSYGTWSTHFTVKKVGESDLEPQVICASFNAG